MIADPETAFAPEAQRPDPDPVARGGTRASALAELLGDPEIRKGIGAAWPLYMMLVLNQSGEVSGTRDEVGAMLGEDGRNVGNWVDRLEAAGIATVAKDRRRMEVSLTGRHMEVALLPETVAVVGEKKDDRRELDERQERILRLVDDARAVGKRIELKVELDC